MKDQQLVRQPPSSPPPRPHGLTDTEYQRYHEYRHQQQPPVTWEPSVLKPFAKKYRNSPTQTTFRVIEEEAFRLTKLYQKQSDAVDEEI